MNQLTFYLNNNVVDPPKNWRETAIEVNYEDGEFKNEQLTINDNEWVRDNIDIINDWCFTQGRIFEGLPYRITETDINGAVTEMFNGYIDCSEDASFDEYGIIVKSKPKYSIDWINDVAQGFGFDYLYAKQVITQSDFFDVPYVISSIPDYEKLAITVIGLTLILQSLVAAGNDLAAAIGSVASGSFDWGNLFILVGAIIKFTALLIAAVALIKRMFAVIIQKVKYHKAIKIKTLFERGCQHLGLSFLSTIINPNDYILPAKYYVPKNPSNPFNLDILGAFQPNEFIQYALPQGTFADFIIKQKDRYNGKVLFDGNVMRFERKDFQLATPSYTLPDIINTKYRLNSSDFKSNLFLNYQTDVSESNTINQYLGTSYQVTIRPNSIVNPEFVLMKGLQQVDFAYALGKRKTELTAVEKVFDEINEAIDGAVGGTINVLNAIINTINDIIDFINSVVEFFENVGDLVGFDFDGPEIPNVPTIEYSPLGDLIDNRIGMLLLEKDSFLVDKVLRLESDGKLSVNQPTAKESYNLFYIIDFFTQYKIQEWNGIPFTLANFNSIRFNPAAFLPDGSQCEIMSAKYNMWNERAEAEIKTRVKYQYTNNLIYTYAEPTGE